MFYERKNHNIFGWDWIVDLLKSDFTSPESEQNTHCPHSSIILFAVTADHIPHSKNAFGKA